MNSDSGSVDGDRLRGRLYEVMDNETTSLSEKQQQVLSLGRRYLDVARGYIQRHRPEMDTDEIVASVGNGVTDTLNPGTRIERATSYCRRTVEADSPVALSDAPNQGWGDDPAYQEHGFDCYLATTVFVDGDTYGTVCFADPDARGATFTPGEKSFVELVARLLGRELEASSYQQRIADAEQARIRSTQKYEALVELAPDAILLVDADTGEIVEANGRASTLTGHEHAALDGMSVFDLSPPAHRDRYVERFTDGIDRHTVANRFDDGTPLLLRQADGTDVPIEISVSEVELGDRTLAHSILRDISDRREREQDRRLKGRAVEAASVGVTIVDVTADDRPLVYANAEFEHVTRYEASAVRGRSWEFLHGPDTDPETVERIRSAIETGEPMGTELLNYRADGTPFWNEMTLTPVTGPNGSDVTHYIGFHRDITARKRRDRLFEVLDRVLRHNLRNDMNAVRGFANLIAERTDGEPAAMARRIATTAADLTDLSRKARSLETAVSDPDSPQSRQLADAIRAAVADLRTAHPGVEFTTETAETCEVIAPAQFERALFELGKNAAEHAAEEPVEFCVEPTDEERIAVHVTDNGSGLPDTERQVLEAGRETPLRHGKGLGLWLVNWLVTGVGGDVAATVDDGTTVTLRLPLADGADAESDAYHLYGALSVLTE